MLVPIVLMVPTVLVEGVVVMVVVLVVPPVVQSTARPMLRGVLGMQVVRLAAALCVAALTAPLAQ